MSPIKRNVGFGLVAACLVAGGLGLQKWFRDDRTAARAAATVEKSGTSANPPSSPLRMLERLGQQNASIRPIMDSSLEVGLRFNAAAELADATLSPSELGLLLDYLQTPLSTDAAGEQVARALRNDVLNALRDNNADASMVIPRLVAMAQDPAQDAGLRDYALQHLGAWLPRLVPMHHDLADAALRRALADPAETYAGTALIALHDLQSRRLLTKAFAPKDECRRIAADTRYSSASRVTAMAIASELGLDDASLTDVARRWAADPDSPTTARRVAAVFLKNHP